MAGPLLEVEHLQALLHLTANWLSGSGAAVRAVDGVSFSIQERECLGLVGESGSGKSTVGRAILCPIQSTTGEVRFEGTAPRERASWA